MRNILLLIAVILILTSCNDPDTFHVMSFEISSDFEDESEEYWIFLSDPDGNVLNVAEIQNGSEVTLRIPSSAALPISVNLFKATVTPMEITRKLTTYSHVEFGEYYLARPGTPMVSSEDNITLSLQNFEPKHSIRLSDNVIVSSQTVETIEGKIIFHDESVPFLVSATDSETGEKKFTEFEGFPDTDYTLDYNNMSPFQTMIVEIPEGKAGISQSVFLDDTALRIQYQAFQQSDVSSNVKLYHHPYFDSCFTSIQVANVDGIHTDEFLGNGVPYKFTVLEAMAELKAHDENGFTITTTGVADIIETGYNGTTTVDAITFYDSRTIFLPYEPTLHYTYPKIPEELLKRYFPKGEQWYDLDGARITDFDKITYPGFINHRLVTGRTFEYPIATARKKSFIF
jgi:hypothetical protein